MRNSLQIDITFIRRILTDLLIIRNHDEVFRAQGPKLTDTCDEMNLYLGREGTQDFSLRHIDSLDRNTFNTLLCQYVGKETDTDILRNYFDIFLMGEFTVDDKGVSESRIVERFRIDDLNTVKFFSGRIDINAVRLVMELDKLEETWEARFILPNVVCATVLDMRNV